MTTFMEDYLAGRTDGCTIDEHIAQWHAQENPFGPKLHQYLGMTWAQYKIWEYHRELPERGAP